MNAYVYGYGKPNEERLIVVDLGVTFPDMDGTPGVDLDPARRISVAGRAPRPDRSGLCHARPRRPRRGSVAHVCAALERQSMRAHSRPTSRVAR